MAAFSTITVWGLIGILMAALFTLVVKYRVLRHADPRTLFGRYSNTPPTLRVR